MSQRLTRSIGFVLLAVSLVVLGVGTWNMKERLQNRDLQLVFFENRIDDESFTFRGEPVKLELIAPGEYQPPDNPAAADLAPGLAPEDEADPDRPQLPAIGDDTYVMRYTFRGESVDFPIFDPADAKLFPNADPSERRLELLKDWFGVLPMITGARTAEQAAAEAASGERPARLIIAARYEPGGLKSGWSTVQRQNWIYRIAELRPEGPDPITVVEKTYRELDTLGMPGRRVDPADLPSPEERQRDLWMHYVMQQVTPAPFYRAKDRRLDEALDAMGWTWPVSLGGGFGVVLSVVVIGLGFKSRELPA